MAFSCAESLSPFAMECRRESVNFIIIFLRIFCMSEHVVKFGEPYKRLRQLACMM